MEDSHENQIEDTHEEQVEVCHFVVPPFHPFSHSSSYVMRRTISSAISVWTVRSMRTTKSSFVINVMSPCINFATE